jgi:hypothetical protein
MDLLAHPEAHENVGAAGRPSAKFPIGTTDAVPGVPTAAIFEAVSRKNQLIT